MFRHSSRRKTAAQIGVAALVLATAGLALLGTLGTHAAPASTHAAPASAPVTITYWEPDRLDRSVIPAFERTHPSIKIHEVVVTTYRAKVRTKLKTGRASAPDALEMAFNQLPSYLITGKLLDLSQYGAGS